MAAIQFLAAALFLAAPPARTAAQESSAVRLGVLQTGPYTMVERSDWSRYDNGKYTGHVYHEVRASIKPEPADSGGAAESSETPGSGAFLYQGNFFVMEETLRDMRASARPVDAIIPVSFKVFRDGNMVLKEDNGYPALRGFPAFPRESVKPGTRWTAQGQKAADPKHTGKPVLIPFTAEYEYRGPELYQEIPVHRVRAAYALRYRGGGFTENFSTLTGTHTVDILIQAANGLPLFIRDNLDETYAWPDGSTLRFRGFTLVFNQGTAPVNRETVIASLGNSLGITGQKEPEPPPAAPPAAPPNPGPAESGGPAPGQLRGNSLQEARETNPEKGLELVAVPEGVRLIIRDIRFVPDSDEFLPEERPRLDAITQALRRAAPNQSFLVEGHTASTGRPGGEMELSLRRARRMVDELARRDIAADRFIYKGWGGTRPVGDNNTEEGRNLNRRVEITILD
ncbi:MAG: OmpA family protein [Treponema sp.]|nr:OmpA family protein [Treponema sp.]